MRFQRWFHISIVLSIVTTGAAYAFLQHEVRSLRDYCDHVPIGKSLVDLRKDARETGFEPRIEPFTQMRIEAPAWSWSPSPPSCRVFFDNSHQVEYRIWESS